MRAVTLWQPYASQVFDKLDPKDVENRETLRPPAELLQTPRPYFAVHAGLRYEAAPRFPAGAKIPERGSLVFGAVLGVARVRYFVDARKPHGLGGILAAFPHQPVGPGEGTEIRLRRWFLGPIAWRLVDVVGLLTPVPCSGALGCWTVPLDVERKIREQLPPGV